MAKKRAAIHGSLLSCCSCDTIQSFIEEFLQIFSSLLQEKR